MGDPTSVRQQRGALGVPALRGDRLVIMEETYRTHDRCLPLEHVIARRAGAAGGGRVAAEIDQLLFIIRPRNASIEHDRKKMSAELSWGGTGCSTAHSPIIGLDRRRGMWVGGERLGKVRRRTLLMRLRAIGKCLGN